MFDFENMNFGLEDESTSASLPEIEKVSVYSYLKKFKSAIGLDISANSTGVHIWDGENYFLCTIETEQRIVEEDAYSEAKMRREFKGYLKELVEGKHFEVAVVENVFGGKNFDTVRTLLALNTVFEELVFDGVCSVERFFKRHNQEWKKYLRVVHHIKGANDKIDIEKALIFLEFDYALEHMNDTQAKKDKEGYQDILDCTGLLIALSIELTQNPTGVKKHKVAMKDVEISSIGDMVELDYLDDKVISRLPIKEVVLSRANSMDKSILKLLNEDEDADTVVFASEVSNDRLGAFAIKYNIPFSSQGYCVLLFYKKSIKKLLKQGAIQ